MKMQITVDWDTKEVCLKGDEPFTAKGITNVGTRSIEQGMHEILVEMYRRNPPPFKKGDLVNIRGCENEEPHKVLSVTWKPPKRVTNLGDALVCNWWSVKVGANKTRYGGEFNVHSLIPVV